MGPQRPPKSAVVSFSGAKAVLGVASVRDKPSKAAKGSLAVEGGGTGAGAGAERSPNKSETTGGGGAGAGGSSGAPRSNKDGSGAGGGAGGGGDRLAWRDDAFDALRGARRGAAAVAAPTPPKSAAAMRSFSACSAVFSSGSVGVGARCCCVGAAAGRGAAGVGATGCRGAPQGPDAAARPPPLPMALPPRAVVLCGGWFAYSASWSRRAISSSFSVESPMG